MEDLLGLVQQFHDGLINWEEYRNNTALKIAVMDEEETNLVADAIKEYMLTT